MAIGKIQLTRRIARSLDRRQLSFLCALQSFWLLTCTACHRIALRKVCEAVTNMIYCMSLIRDVVVLLRCRPICRPSVFKDAQSRVYLAIVNNAQCHIAPTSTSCPFVCYLLALQQQFLAETLYSTALHRTINLG